MGVLLLPLALVVALALVDAVRLELTLRTRRRHTEALIEGWRREGEELQRRRRNSDRGLN